MGELNLRQHYTEFIQDESTRKTHVNFRWIDDLQIHFDNGRANLFLVELFVFQTELATSTKRGWIYCKSKRLFDICLSIVGLILISPLIVVISIAVKLNSSGPVFFVQSRAGLHARSFKIFKFRTMYHVDIPNHRVHNPMSNVLFKCESDPRITSVGRFLRRWSLDELPQLVNILMGDMSFVGPRPLSLNDSATIPPELYARFAVSPGLTGLWQATCRDSLDGYKKLSLDCEYAKNGSWKLDLWILFRTVFEVLSGRGAW